MVSSTFSESTLHKYIEAALLCNSFKLKLLLRIYAFESFAFRMHKLVPPVCRCDVALESTQFAAEMLFSCVNKHVNSQSQSFFGRKITLVAFEGFLFWMNTHVSFQGALQGGIVALVALKRFVSVVYSHNVLFKIWIGSTTIFAKLTFVGLFSAVRKQVFFQARIMKICLTAYITGESFFSTLESMNFHVWFQMITVIRGISTLIATK